MVIIIIIIYNVLEVFEEKNYINYYRIQLSYQTNPLKDEHVYRTYRICNAFVINNAAYATQNIHVFYGITS